MGFSGGRSWFWGLLLHQVQGGGFPLGFSARASNKVIETPNRSSLSTCSSTCANGSSELGHPFSLISWKACTSTMPISLGTSGKRLLVHPLRVFLAGHLLLSSGVWYTKSMSTLSSRSERTSPPTVTFFSRMGGKRIQLLLFQKWIGALFIGFEKQGSKGLGIPSTFSRQP